MEEHYALLHQPDISTSHTGLAMLEDGDDLRLGEPGRLDGNASRKAPQEVSFQLPIR